MVPTSTRRRFHRGVVRAIDRRVVVIGAVEPVIRAALNAAWSATFAVVSVGAAGAALISEARAVGAAAVVMRRDDLNELSGQLPEDIVTIGISAASFDLMVCVGSVEHHVPNPTPDAIARVILDAMPPGAAHPPRCWRPSA